MVTTNFGGATTPAVDGDGNPIPIDQDKRGDDVGTESDDEGEPGTAINASDPVDVKPIEDHLTIPPTGDTDPTADDGRPDAFIVGDQTAAGALTPKGGRNPGEPAQIPGMSGNLQDPHNVNGSERNQQLIRDGHGIKDPKFYKDA